jgi:membrane protein DedA with SNARE-associated domain
MPQTLITLLLTYRYWLIFPLVFFEGPIMAVIIGFLISLGYFDILPAYIVMLLGDIIPDTMYYAFGRLGHARFAKTKLGKRLKAMDHLWKEHTFKSMLLAKWAYGLSTPLLASAGLSQLSLGKFLRSAIPITMAQYAILLAVGYEFVASYQLISKSLLYAQLFVASGIVLIIGLFFVLKLVAKRALPAS